ncbi:hypothetical protein [Marinobacterium litorale]|jgi:hypothetical protein|uniref:hypothetical protein n=1 Tax=Marinobacterium litorale TaxID=404770 RepID=UPI000420935A|nr:hypothetical protein [Marinobacterium litorale]
MYPHRLLIVVCLITLLLGPELLDLWLFGEGPWHRPFLIGIGVCMLIALIEHWHRHER